MPEPTPRRRQKPPPSDPVKPAPGETRTTLAIHGAREHNLKNVTIEIPRDRLVVITGLSGSGKSSLAFDTIYAEGQRRYMESLSSYSKRFIEQVSKPDVDFMFGLSPVISIEQKTVSRNPRSTVGTMTDISNYLNLLFATVGVAHCPYCKIPIPVKTKNQILDELMSLPSGTPVELRAPVFKVYGEDLNYLFTEIRKKGYRRMIVDGKPLDISEDQDLDAAKISELEVIVDKLVIGSVTEKHLLVAIQNALMVGDNFLKVHIVKADKNTTAQFHSRFGCKKHHTAVGEMAPEYFMFNVPYSACRTCLGLGTYMQVHPDLLAPDKTRSIIKGAFVKEAGTYNPDTWHGRMLYSLSKHYKFSLETPYKDLSKKIVDILLYGSKEKFPLLVPPDAKDQNFKHSGRQWGWDGIARWIERTYKRYRQKQVANSGMEAWLEKVMVEYVCPDCSGARLKSTRMLFTINGKTIHEVGGINFSELRGFLGSIGGAQSVIRGRSGVSCEISSSGRQIVREIAARLDLLLGIGLDYLNFNRRSGTLSGGESQRIRLSTQIGSGLMGMMYVLDEPSIGLHPKDNEKMIATLHRLRDLGNTVLVVEHDEDTIRAADHIVEMGPGPGIHGGNVVASGTIGKILACKESPTGQFLSGAKKICTPEKRRPGNGRQLVIREANENNLRKIDVSIPLGRFVCVTGASGSGKSTLINEILFKALHKRIYDTRTLPGKHTRVDGIEHVGDVVNIDQSPIGRSSRSNPATYIGFYDDIRTLFSNTPEARKRGYNPGRFSFNVKTGRCPECQGEGAITTQLYFMPDVEARCEACKGARYNPETLEVTYKGKTIADVLDMPIETGEKFFDDVPNIAKKIAVLNQLGLGYITLGQSSTTLSGGEAQRVKLANELSTLRKSSHTLYILDEPTTGLHLADIARLIESLNRLVTLGHTVLVIEHHLDVIKMADWIIDLGPEGGHSGGEIVCTGTPEAVAACKTSHTGKFLEAHLKQ